AKRQDRGRLPQLTKVIAWRKCPSRKSVLRQESCAVMANMSVASQKPEAPGISAILCMANGFDGIRKAIRHLCLQTAREQLELVIVATPDQASRVESDQL